MNNSKNARCGKIKKKQSINFTINISSTTICNGRCLLQVWKVFLFYIWSEIPPLPVGQGPLIHEVSRSHTTTHHSRQESPGRMISPSQRPLPDSTQHSRQIRPWWDSKPTIPAGRPTRQTARPLGPVICDFCRRHPSRNAAPWLRRLVAGVSLLTAGFDSRLFHRKRVEDKVLTAFIYFRLSVSFFQ